MTATATTLMVAAGGLVALGLFLLVAEWIPAPPALGPALRRLHPLASATTTTHSAGWLRRRLSVPHADLRLLGRSTHQYWLSLGVAALMALALPVLITAAAVVVLGVPIFPVLPAAGGLLAAAGAAWLAHRDVLAKAATARAEFRRAMCTYLDLTAHQVLAGHGPVQSLTRAASVCHGLAFTRIREALLSAELQLTPPWEQLRVLAHDIEVVELVDLADIMSTAGNEGADVHDTLRAKVASLRDTIRTDAMAEAEVRTSKLDIPASALIVVVLVLMGYPFMTRLFVH